MYYKSVVGLPRFFIFYMVKIAVRVRATKKYKKPRLKSQKVIDLKEGL